MMEFLHVALGDLGDFASSLAGQLPGDHDPSAELGDPPVWRTHFLRGRSVRNATVKIESRCGVQSGLWRRGTRKVLFYLQ